MAKNIIMKVLTGNGYEELYPFIPSQILNCSFQSTSTSTKYNLTIKGVPTPLTNDFGNTMGILCFIPNVNNGANLAIYINDDPTGYPVLFSDGSTIRENTLVANRMVFVKYYNNNFYLILDKNQIGLGSVTNIAPADMPISTATQTALNNKMNVPVLIPRSANLNSYMTPGLYYTSNSSDASTIVNVPSNSSAFSLFVEKHSGIKQTFTAYTANGVQMWVRNYNNTSWTSWYQIAVVLSGTSEPGNNIGENGNIYLKYEV